MVTISLVWLAILGFDSLSATLGLSAQHTEVLEPVSVTDAHFGSEAIGQPIVMPEPLAQLVCLPNGESYRDAARMLRDAELLRPLRYSQSLRSQTSCFQGVDAYSGANIVAFYSGRDRRFEPQSYGIVNFAETVWDEAVGLMPRPRFQLRRLSLPYMNQDDEGLVDADIAVAYSERSDVSVCTAGYIADPLYLSHVLSFCAQFADSMRDGA